MRTSNLIWVGALLLMGASCEKGKDSSQSKQNAQGKEIRFHKDKKMRMVSKEELKKKLTKEQYYVTQEDGTERAFQNEFWNHKEDGIYVDIVSGEPLFSSEHKFDSGTGWPSFYTTIKSENIVEMKDESFGMVRTEVRSKNGDSHLGHLFNDGPKPTGLRYCINSASLRFVAKKDLEKEGYGEFKKLFEK